MSHSLPCLALLLAAAPGAQPPELQSARSALVEEAGKRRGTTQAGTDRLEQLGLVYLEACNQCAPLQECDADRRAILAGRAPAQDPCSPPPPDDREGRGLLARGLGEMKARQHGRATVYLHRAATAGVVEAHLHLGSCYAQLGRMREGAWHYEEFLLKAPGAPQAPSVREILRSYYASSRTRPRHPHLLDASSHLSVLPPSPKPGSREHGLRDAALARGVALVKERKYRQAIPPLEEAAKLGASQGHLYLGVVYAHLKDSDRGAWHYEEFVHLDPRHPSAPQAREILRQFFAKSHNRKPRYPL